MIPRLLLSLLFLANLAFAEIVVDGNTTEVNRSNIQETQNLQQHIVSRLAQLQLQADAIDKEILDRSVLAKIYSNYSTLKILQKQYDAIQKSIDSIKLKKRLTQDEQEHLDTLLLESETLQGKLELLSEYEKDPFKKYLEPPKIEEVPTVGNPFAIIGAISYREKLISAQDEYLSRYETLEDVIEKLRAKEKIIKEMYEISGKDEKYHKVLLDIKEEIMTFASVLDIFKTTQNVYSKKVDEITLSLKKQIADESKKTVYIGGLVLFFLVLLILAKYIVKRYMSDIDRYYTINKALNLTFFIFVIFTLLFAYIQNVSYLVTILGFASAGIAIAMKDWFMSVMGWFVIVIGGAIHVGDRVKFVRGNTEYVGDIVDISLLRMTMHEDVTLTTQMTNRRAGRIVFIPNNFIFTDMISNYAHAGLKTVWDGIEFVVTFDSNFKKAASISKEIAKKYSKGYTDITRKQLNKLRSQYHMKNTNVEPRIFTLIDTYGMKISVWYLTNSYATLTLRSTISAEIIARLHEEEDINLAFPTQSIYVDKDVRKPPIEAPTKDIV
ncbi:mechanosensitive ion channel domain-containing protein [Sulfurovum mangrovi]|uniref:mechanosensitive ion channel domain-containing protein n=1 Tax=Sulfurovum mangrovi TaxID=2893889 RepID=UPI001E31F35B|nr:mechanosensitive ion channel domain-containing protein [Sulfurovum mangrovi]UFH60073.1 mechanosensitive ion channel [Sulfurovum mangrovi]